MFAALTGFPLHSGKFLENTEAPAGKRLAPNIDTSMQHVKVVHVEPRFATEQSQ